MKDIYVFLNESTNEPDAEFNSDIINAIQELDPNESIAGMNCYDLTYAFGMLLKKHKINNMFLQKAENIRCACFSNGHYCPVFNIHGVDILIDFTWSNQKQFEAPIMYFNTSLKTNKGGKFVRFMPLSMMPSKLNLEIGTNDLDDFVDEFEEIFLNDDIYN